MRIERLERGALDGALREGVLHHAVRRLHCAQLPAQLGHLRHVEALVVHQDGGLDARERGRETFQLGLFLSSRDCHLNDLCRSPCGAVRQGRLTAGAEAPAPHQRVLACSTDVVSMRTPGPMVDETVMLFTYRPFAAAGFAFT